jgi:hypothetical protein
MGRAYNTRSIYIINRANSRKPYRYGSSIAGYVTNKAVGKTGINNSLVTYSVLKVGPKTSRK